MPEDLGRDASEGLDLNRDWGWAWAWDWDRTRARDPHWVRLPQEPRNEDAF